LLTEEEIYKQALSYTLCYQTY